MKWQAVAPGLTYRDGGEELVYFCQGSGSTHLISPVTEFILDLLRESPRSPDELVAALANHTEDVSEEEIRESIDGILTDLESSELIAAV